MHRLIRGKLKKHPLNPHNNGHRNKTSYSIKADITFPLSLCSIQPWEMCLDSPLVGHSAFDELRFLVIIYPEVGGAICHFLPCLLPIQGCSRKASWRTFSTANTIKALASHVPKFHHLNTSIKKSNYHIGGTGNCHHDVLFHSKEIASLFLDNPFYL